MSHRYITLADANTFLGTSGEDTLVDSLIESAESLFDNLIGSQTGLLTSDKTEFFDINDTSKPLDKRNRVFDLGTFFPTVVKTINGVSPGTVNTDYTLTRNRLELKTAIRPPMSFPYRHTIVYTSGYANINAIPADIRHAVKILVAGMYTTKGSHGIASIRQDLLSITYDKNSILDRLIDGNDKSLMQAVIQNYTVYSVIS